MAEEEKREPLGKCWWCGAYFNGILMLHICTDGTTHEERQSKPTKSYDANKIEWTMQDLKILKGLKIAP